MSHLDPIKQKIRTAPVVPPPAPWKKIPSILMGGLTEVGFANDSELLLILSHQGRGILDCTTGQKLARDSNEDRTHWYAHDDLLAKGIGPLEGQEIRLAGLWGGGLSTQTSDGWSVESITLEWPDQHLLLMPPRSDLYKPADLIYKLAIDSEVRAFGFSYTGKTLIIAVSSNIAIFGRD